MLMVVAEEITFNFKCMILVKKKIFWFEKLFNIPKWYLVYFFVGAGQLKGLLAPQAHPLFLIIQRRFPPLSSDTIIIASVAGTLNAYDNHCQNKCQG